MTSTIFTNARLIDGDSPPRDGMAITIEGDRIARIEPAAALTASPHDIVYNLGGRSVMPGMVIGHYHASYTGVGGGSPMPVGMEAPPALQALRAGRHLGMALEAGFTGVVSAGAPYAIDASCKAAIEQGVIKGPRVVAGSRDVSTTGHAQDWWAWHWGPGMSAGTNIVDGADAFRRAVREEIKRGAEIIKIFATPGHGIPGRIGLEVSEGELQAAIETAHERGARIRAHMTSGEAILKALRLGIDVIDHGDGVDAECIEELVARRVPLVPSMLYPYRVCQFVKSATIDHMREDLDKMFETLPHLVKAGVILTLGDDHGAVPLDHGNYADELEFYVHEAGVAPLEVIRWATKNGAILMGRASDLGTLEVGKLADLIVVDGDPVADVRLLKADRDAILAVMKGGEFARSRLDRFLTQPDAIAAE